jgi:predicted SnoaL-like aldol condensation-catalyzing enzyme
MMRFQLLTLASIVLVAASMPLPADSINPATNPQTAPLTSREKKNLQFALDFTRDVLQARHTELSEKYQAEDYIQHNPNIPTGRAAFVAFFSRRPPVNPLPKNLDPAPVVMGAKGDYVWLIMEREDKDPREPSKTYHFNTFDVYRLENGRIQEHWDSAQRNPPQPGAVAQPTASQPSRGKEGSTGKVSGTEKKNIGIATLELKDMLQYGHLELADKVMDAGYIQHNPNVPQGREGFKQFMSRVPGRKPEEIKPEWKAAPVLTLANGPYVVMMWDRKAKDPADPSKEYTWDHFDVVRIEEGIVKEHWDEARIAPQAAQGR